MGILNMKNIAFSYGKGKERNEILKDVTYSFEKGKMYAIVGRSGEGKSTTLALLGALEMPDSGEILYEGEDIKKMGGQIYRNQKVSIIFQNYNLLPYLNAYENVELAISITKNKVEKSKEHILDLLHQVGISEELSERQANRLSGGEQQRVAIARALASDSEIILADEPTGNLDEETASEINRLLYQLAHEQGKCVIVVTHTKELSGCADTVLHLKEKQLVEC